jgi:DNA-binding transcriptional LysR family regulator
VGTEQCLGVIDLPPLLARFRRAHPGVEIRLQQAGSAQLVEEIRLGRMDGAFVAVPGRLPDGVRPLPLATEPMMLLCHREHRLAASDAVDWPMLRDEVFVDFSADWGARQVSDRAFAAAGVERQVPWRSTTCTPCSTWSIRNWASPWSPVRWSANPAPNGCTPFL